MPTPRPIITASSVVKSGIDMKWLPSVIRAVPVPMPKSATPTGRPTASTDPNASNRMKTAKPKPIASDDGFSNSANTSPPSSTWRPSIPSGTRPRVVSAAASQSLWLASGGKPTPA